ncbi:unnamed protein product, partial [Mesorhabditis spiculigera]
MDEPGPSTAKKANISVLYARLFQDANSVDWTTFFTVQSSPEHLTTLIENLHRKEITPLKDALHELLDRSLTVFLQHSDIQAFNALTTVSTVINLIGQKMGLNDEGIEFLFSAEARKRIPDFAKRIAYILGHSRSDEMKLLCWNALLKIATTVADVSENRLLLDFCCQDILEAILIQFLPTADPSHADYAINLFSILLSHFDGSMQLLLRLAMEDEEHIFEGLNEKFRGFFDLKADYMVAGEWDMTSLYKKHKREPKTSPFVDTGSRTNVLEIASLFTFYSTCTTNKKLLTLLFATDFLHHQPCTIGIFLSYCSYALFNYETETQLLELSWHNSLALMPDASRLRAKLCFLTLLKLVDDAYVLAELHNDVRARNIAFDPRVWRGNDDKPKAALLGAAVLEILVGFIKTSLKTTIPLEFFDFALGIIHRILVFLRERELRIDEWKPLFLVLFALLKFLRKNEHKLPYSEPLVLRVVMLLNFFITYGDQFLPDDEAYEFVYYEILRNPDLFKRLESSLKASPENEVTEKTLAQLENQLIIIKTIQPTLDAIDEYPTEKQVYAAIRENLDQVELRLFPTITVVDRYEAGTHQRTFFDLLSVKLAGRLHSEVEAAEIDYTKALAELGLS